MSRTPHISVIGSINVDEKITMLNFPVAGETLTAVSYGTGGGGKGANQAIACARAGFKSPDQPGIKVDQIGAVGKGDGQYEAIIERLLRESGVGREHIIRASGIPTGKSVVLVDKDGENRIIFCPGANYAAMGNAGAIVRSVDSPGLLRPQVVVMQGEIPAETTVALLETFRAGSSEPRMIFNPAPMYTTGLPAHALRDLAILVVNESECLALRRLLTLSAPTDQDSVVSSTLDLSQLDATAEYLIHEMGVELFIVTLGVQGAYSASRESSGAVVPCLQVAKVIDSTAAGDTFVGYLAAHVSEALVSGIALSNMDWYKIIESANRAASKCVGRIGAMDSIPYGFE